MQDTKSKSNSLGLSSGGCEYFNYGRGLQSFLREAGHKCALGGADTNKSRSHRQIEPTTNTRGSGVCLPVGHL
jgi:hypothetical protein